MAMPRYETVREYLSAQPPGVRKILAKVRDAIRTAVPAAEESVSYGIPTYKLDGKPLLYFAAWKAHYAVYPASPALVKALGKALAGHAVEKGTIRFGYDDDPPVRLITRIAKLRVKLLKAE